MKNDDAPIEYVNFTTRWPDGEWHLACTVFAPTPGTADTYECDWKLPAAGLANGPFTLSFDVYDDASPHDVRRSRAPRSYLEPESLKPGGLWFAE